MLELDDVRSVSGVSLDTGPPLEGFPRGLSISTSIDGAAWEEAWSGATGGPIVEGVLENPKTTESRFGFAARRARFVRLRQIGEHPDIGWFIAELKAYGPAGF